MNPPGDIRIVSDGTAQGTRVLNADGDELDLRITRVEWSVDVGSGLSRAIIHTIALGAEVEISGANVGVVEEHVSSATSMPTDVATSE